MPIYRSFNEIVNSMRERLKLTQPNLDTKPGTFARDLFIDIQADQLERLHKALLLISEKQSPASASGTDLDKLASNYGISRKSSNPATGTVVFTTNDFSADIPIPSNTIVTSKNGLTFKVIGNYTLAIAEKNRYAANASRLKKLLNLAGITDSYVIEVAVQATAGGRNGNIAPYQIISSNLQESLKVINLTAFSNGDNSETDIAFRTRIFSSFAGANTGTYSGYRNTALGITGVLDVLIAEPGNALMLRDGTETIKVNDGSFRILNSGTGGKVDLYILGKQLNENSESFIYIDKSGTGDATDERNDYIPGISFLDKTYTIQEQRLNAFENGQIPLQPINSIISVSGSSSGILAAKSTDANGVISGNYELIKDQNIETGGSPFGFDYLHFIKNTKAVEGDTIIKQNLNSIDPLKFTDVKNINDIYLDRQIQSENSTVLGSDRTKIYLNHSPVVTVSKVVNTTTGEVYVIESQNLNPDTNLNEDGYIKISGKTLPTPADILSVNYIWRQYFDKYIDYNGSNIPQIFHDNTVNDSIDWGTSNSINIEACTISQNSDNYQIETNYNISRIVSVFTFSETTNTVINLTNADNEEVLGIKLNSSDAVISNIYSIKYGSLEIWNTGKSDGLFNTRLIYLPSDSPISLGSEVSIKYNKLEFYNYNTADGNYSDNIITLPTTESLKSVNLDTTLEELFLADDTIYVSYIAAISECLPIISLTNLPITGTDDNNQLFNNSYALISSSFQPIFYEFNNSNKTDIIRFSPSRLACIATGISKAGKIKLIGTSLKRLELSIKYGINVKNNKFNIKNEVLDALGLSQAPSTIGIARIDEVIAPNSENYDIAGYSILSSLYDISYAIEDSSLSNLEFKLPSTVINNNFSLSSTDEIKVICLIYQDNDFEDIYFPTNQTVYTNKLFGIINKISVVSGFKNTAGGLSGSLNIKFANQPGNNIAYNTDYEFTAPKEGERITIRYSINNLIRDVTSAIEDVRTITADVLVKESISLPIDVIGQILINENAQESEIQIIENVANAVTNLLNPNTLGSTIDYSDIISVASSISGVDSVNISLFNFTNELGRRNFIKALDNENIVAGNVTFTSVSRKNFKIT